MLPRAIAPSVLLTGSTATRILARNRTFVRIHTWRDVMGSNGNRLNVDGHTFWRADSNGRRVELTTATGIELDGQLCRWTVSPPGAQSTGKRVESASPHVRRFMNSVLGEMQRATHQATVRPVPKPQPQTVPALSRSERPHSGRRATTIRFRRERRRSRRR